LALVCLVAPLPDIASAQDRESGFVGSHHATSRTSAYPWSSSAGGLWPTAGRFTDRSGQSWPRRRSTSSWTPRQRKNMTPAASHSRWHRVRHLQAIPRLRRNPDQSRVPVLRLRDRAISPRLLNVYGLLGVRVGF
jgi:hypothetical protein